ncbi:hypothetical protein GCM10007386_15000 [Pseudoduganella dura]|nr:hypothetical protein GCM10007386_15000 [Pseudoduganella dura]
MVPEWIAEKMMMKKRLALAVGLFSLGLAVLGAANAMRMYSTDYEFMDEQGNPAGWGHMPCYGPMVMEWGIRTTNYIASNQLPCRTALPCAGILCPEYPDAKEEEIQ